MYLYKISGLSSIDCAAVQVCECQRVFVVHPELIHAGLMQSGYPANGSAKDLAEKEIL